MSLRLKVGKKGYIIIPKAIREAVGIEEGDEVIIEVKDGIIIKPLRKNVDVELIRRLFKEHVDRLKKLKDRVEPTPGELAKSYLEEEFED